MKPRVLLINTVSGYGSVGRITASLSKSKKYDSLVCYGRKKDFANVYSYRFANIFDNIFGALQTILFDNNLNICTKATGRLIERIKEYNPDIIHLQNIHGYYLNITMLFNFLKDYKKPVIWTLHDTMSFTGYCPDPERIGCRKFEKGCKNCPYDFAYPFSLFLQNVESDYENKKILFNSIQNLTLVTPSNYLQKLLKISFLRKVKSRVINNGIDLSNFKITKKKNKRFTVLAVASQWSNDKGPDDLNKIIKLLDKDIDVVVVGRNSNIINATKCIARTNNVQELADLYSSSHVLINTTLDDIFPTVNIESLACGTPVVTYKTGGSPEIIDKKTGIVVEKGDVVTMAKTINKLKNKYYFKSKDCVKRARMYSLEKMCSNYYDLYKTIYKK